MARLRFAWCAALLLAVSGPAHAGDPARAELLFQEGLALTDGGDWDAACPKFAESDELDPSVGAMLNLAFCSDRAGKLLESRARYEEAARRNASTADESRRASVDDQVRVALEKLAARTPRLKVTVAPADAKLTVDGREIAMVAEGVPLDPGLHKVRATAPGHRDEEREVNLVGPQRVDVSIALVRTPAPVPPAPRPLPEREPEGSSPTLVPGIVLLSGGVIAAGVGATLLGLTASKAAEVRELCGPNARPPLCAGTPEDAAKATDLSHEAKTFEIAGGVLAGAGAATAATGLILVLVGVQEEQGTPAIGVTISPKEVAWTISQTF